MGTPKTRRRGAKGDPGGLRIKAEIIRAISRIWSRLSPDRKQVLDANTYIVFDKKKDGTLSKKYRRYYPCKECGEGFELSEIQIDHVKPSGDFPGWPPGTGRSWDDWLAAKFCGVDNLQRLCKSCHQEKSNQERKRNEPD